MKRGRNRITKADLQKQQQPQSHQAIDDAPHSDLRFYDIYLSNLYNENNNNNNTGNHTRSQSSSDPLPPGTLKRRRAKRHRHDNSKSRDLYADLVLLFNYKNQQESKGALSKDELEKRTMDAYEDVLEKLTRVGLQYETRPGGKDTILIFILCPWSVLKREVASNSIHDWLTGVKVAETFETEQLLEPSKDRDNSLDNLTDSIRLRLIHELIIGLPREGGAGIYPDENEYVESILPLHDPGFNKYWLTSWSTKWIVSQRDFSRIQDHFGEKVAYYFQFLEFYFFWLIFPSVLGILIHFIGSSFSVFYSVSVILWAVVFIESWKRRERELALWWGVSNIKRSEAKRFAFKGDTMVTDPITGEVVAHFSPWKRWARKIAGLPVIFAGALALSVLVTLLFGVEVFLEVYYGGYMKEILTYLPTIVYTLAMPYVEDTCNIVSRMLTDFENYETEGSYDYHLVQKVFIFKVLNSYLAILLTAYVYIPFGPRVIEFLQAYGLPFATVAVEPRMLQDRLQAFMITNQAIGFFSETILPWITRSAMKGAVKIQKEVTEALLNDESEESEESDGPIRQDPEEVREFLRNVRAQADLPVYDVNDDYAEMAEQFGYISLFSVIWPLTGLCALINNWIELRSDAAKICFHTRRPLPSRTDTIGPWINNLEYLAWFSSLTNASILYLFKGVETHSNASSVSSSSSTTATSPASFVFSGAGSRLSLSTLLFCLLASEHAYLALRWGVQVVLKSIPTAAELAVRRKEYNVKRSWLTRLNRVSGTNFGDFGLPNGMPNGMGEGGSAEASVPVAEDHDREGRKEEEDGDLRARNGQQKTDTGVNVQLKNSLEHDLGAQAIRSMFKSL
ncbi:hypothetical protein BG011_007298 [Mortierella polycephala]|uniref:DUF590-domain-containing protein n=1 Tax=Mortierella polycephala TaxID=41804 RepID=A0A9P6TYD8_9FUNG|nr:hypothetical protein BG011_007298 [Mortierella polycephala]